MLKTKTRLISTAAGLFMLLGSSPGCRPRQFRRQYWLYTLRHQFPPM